MAVQFKRVILITGSTDGIGRQTALELAARNKTNFVIIHGRNEEKCKAAINYIMDEIKLDDRSNLDYVVADFSDLIEVVKMTEEVIDRFPKLNVLVCNAGVLLPKRTESRNGLELTFQVNHLAHFLLINQFLELLKLNAPARVILVSSPLHSWDAIDWNDIMAEKQYDKYLQFSRTKLMNHLTAFALHHFLRRSSCIQVTSNVVQLNKLESNVRRQRERSKSASLSSSDMALMTGSDVDILITLIESEILHEISGKYFDCHGRQIMSAAIATDERTQQKLWEYSTKLCSKFL